MHLHHRFAATAPILAFALLGAAPPSAAHPAVVAQAEPPQIVAAAVNPSPVHPGDDVVVTVATTPNVVAVDAQVKSYHFHLDPVEAGQFRATGKVPKIARFFKGTYHVVFTAHCAGGQTTQFGEDVVLN